MVKRYKVIDRYQTMLLRNWVCQILIPNYQLFKKLTCCFQVLKKFASNFQLFINLASNFQLFTKLASNFQLCYRNWGGDRPPLNLVFLQPWVRACAKSKKKEVGTSGTYIIKPYLWRKRKGWVNSVVESRARKKQRYAKTMLKLSYNFKRQVVQGY